MPTAWCPKPELWTASDSDSAECEVTELVAAFVRALQPELVVETGTCWGQTAEAIGRALAANGHGRLVSLEVDEERVAASRARCAGLPVEVLCRPSMSWEPSEPIGFAWFDSLLDLRVAEFVHFGPWLEVGSLVGFHDTAPHFGTYGAIVEGLPRLRPLTLRTPRGVTFAEVIRAP